MKTTAPEWAMSVTVGLLLLTVLSVSALTSGAVPLAENDRNLCPEAIAQQ